MDAFPHSKLKAILAYVEKGRLIADLKEKAPHVIPFDTAGNFTTTATKEEKELWPIWKSFGPSGTPQGAVVRWRVELAPGDPNTGTWDDPDLMQGWSDYYPATLGDPKICTVTGTPLPLTSKHPRGIRNSADGAKLISSNDKSGFTFRGRFEEGGQAVSVGLRGLAKGAQRIELADLQPGRRVRHGDQYSSPGQSPGSRFPHPSAI